MLPIVNPNDFKEDKQIAAQLLANKDSNNMTNNDIADMCNIDVRTLYRWQSEPEFIALMNYYAELSQAAFVPELYTHVRKAVRGGSVRAMELALKQQGKLIERREISGQVGIEQYQGMDQQAILNDIEKLKSQLAEQQKLLQKPKPEIVDAEVVEDE